MDPVRSKYSAKPQQLPITRVAEARSIDHRLARFPVPLDQHILGRQLVGNPMFQPDDRSISRAMVSDHLELLSEYLTLLI